VLVSRVVSVSAFSIVADIDFMYHTKEANARGTRSRPIAKHENPDRAVYAISVAGELTGVDPQMLRIYESRGLLTPARTEGGTRRYSDRDLERIERITKYLDAGLNLAGIERVFLLEAESDDLRDQVRELGGRPRRPR
jgi:MerR family transcriptional regulator/heat shock protein HspR